MAGVRRSGDASDASGWRGRRVLVTGGAGVVGSHIADRLLDAGVAEVVVLDNFSRGRRSNLADAAARGRLRIVAGDLRDRQLVAEVMRGIDVVFHEAAIRLTQCVEDPRLGLEVMVDGTFNVIEAAAQARVAKLVAASSASIYGTAEYLPIDECHPPYTDRTLYGAAKLFGEGLLRAFRDTHGLAAVALRYFNVYGPRMDLTGAYTEVLVRWIERIAAGAAPVIFGDGAPTLDLIHVRDVAAANLLAAECDVVDDVLNIASGTEISLVELARTLLALMGSPLQPEHAPARTVYTVPRRLAAIDKAQALLGFAPRVSLHDGLTELVDWWRAQQSAEG